MTRPQIAAIAAEFGMTQEPYSTRPYWKQRSEPVDVEFGISQDQLYFGLIFESEYMEEENFNLLLPIADTTERAARTILTRLFRKAYFAMPEAEAFTHA